MDRNRRLTVAKLLVLVVVIGLLGRGSLKVWPLESWPMYHDRGSTPVADEVTEYEVRVLGPEGETVGTVRQVDVYGLDRASAVDEIFADAFGPDATAEGRDFVARLVEDRHPDATTMEGWLVTWDVDVGARPPLRRAEPTTEIRVTTVPLQTPDGEAGT